MAAQSEAVRDALSAASVVGLSKCGQFTMQPNSVPLVVQEQKMNYNFSRSGCDAPRAQLRFRNPGAAFPSAPSERPMLRTS